MIWAKVRAQYVPTVTWGTKGRTGAFVHEVTFCKASFHQLMLSQFSMITLEKIGLYVISLFKNFDIWNLGKISDRKEILVGKANTRQVNKSTHSTGCEDGGPHLQLRRSWKFTNPTWAPFSCVGKKVSKNWIGEAWISHVKTIRKPMSTPHKLPRPHCESWWSQTGISVRNGIFYDS